MNPALRSNPAFESNQIGDAIMIAIPEEARPEKAGAPVQQRGVSEKFMRRPGHRGLALMSFGDGLKALRTLPSLPAPDVAAARVPDPTGVNWRDGAG